MAPERNVKEDHADTSSKKDQLFDTTFDLC